MSLDLSMSNLALLAPPEELLDCSGVSGSGVLVPDAYQEELEEGTLYLLPLIQHQRR